MTISKSKPPGPPVRVCSVSVSCARYNLPHPTAVFELDYFRERPQPFYILAKELYPGNFKPTLCHYFIRLLHQKCLLVRHFTQNIDTLERIAGVPGDKIVEAHGSFASAHCINPSCREEYSPDWVKGGDTFGPPASRSSPLTFLSAEAVFSDRIPHCLKCQSLVKPGFFLSTLPPCSV